ncbi:MAG: MFS transporter [Bryobacteraceae bacterium]|jgi:MFS family permease
MKLPATLRTLGYRNFQLFFGGQLISLIGTWMQNIAQSWLVYRLTGSSVLLGAVAFAGQIPIFFLAPLGGIVADRRSRRRIVIATQTASMLLAFALAALTLTGTVHVWHVFVLASSLGAVNAFDIPARQSFQVEMVGKADLMNAIALNSSMFNASRVIGPAIAGILVAAIGEGWCFFLNAVSYLAVITGLLLMNVEERQRGAPGISPWASVMEGFGFVVRNMPVHAILMLLGVVSLAGMPYTTLMPIFADRILHGGPRAMGWLMGCAGVGALGGALRLASRTELKGLGRWLPVASFAFGATLIGFAWSRVFWLSACILVLAGFGMMIEMASSNTLVQSMAPDELRGRVMSVYSMVFMGMAPFGALLAGAAADRFGAPWTVTGSGIVCMAAAFVYWTQLARIRGPARQLIAAQRDPPVEESRRGR